MRTWPLAGNLVMGAMASWEDRALFHRAPVVIAASGAAGSLLRISRYLDDAAEGEELERKEWEALLRQREAMEVPHSIAARAGLRVWVFRRGLALDRERAIDELRTQGRLVSDPWRGGKDDVACLVVDKGSAGLREAWANQATRGTEEALSRRDAVKALAAAETAFNLESQMTPRRVALLALAHLLAGHAERSAGYVTMAERSVGKAFANEVDLEMKDLARDYGVGTRNRRCGPLSHAPLLSDKKAA